MGSPCVGRHIGGVVVILDIQAGGQPADIVEVANVLEKCAQFQVAVVTMLFLVERLLLGAIGFVSIADGTLIHAPRVETLDNAEGENLLLGRNIVEPNGEVLLLGFGQNVGMSQTIGTCLVVGRDILFSVQFNNIDGQLTRYQKLFLLQIGNVCRWHRMTVGACPKIGSTIETGRIGSVFQLIAYIVCIHNATGNTLELIRILCTHKSGISYKD